ncbi:MAG: hypothetical protein WAL32_05480 [Terriglobales bacterium]
MKPKDLLILLLLTFGALQIHGYHPWAEDSELYVPGIEKTLHPNLFPFNSQFFETHAGSTLFPNLVAEAVRLSHLPLTVVLFILHVASIYLFLLACWQLARRCFPGSNARWAGVTLIAALLTLPVAGTALYIFDQYLNPRNLAAFLSIFAIVKVLDKKYVYAGLLLVLTAAIHPLMAVFAIAYCFLLVALPHLDLGVAALACLLPFGITFAPPSAAYHQAALTHSFHYITRWAWYEWLGMLAPLPILYWFSRRARTRDWQNLNLLCRTLVVYELIFFPFALVLSTVPRFEALARLQPMRSLFLLYILLFLFIGGLLGECILKNQIWRWLALFLPLCAGMFVAQLALFPASRHIEWPGAAPINPWEQAFVWTREHTPTDAIFALDPEVLKIPGEDEQGFRAIAQRSRLADHSSDAGAVSMFPGLAEEWLRQVQAQAGWKHFTADDLRRLHADFGVTWAVFQSPGIAGLDCPYRNSTVLVCRGSQGN